MATKKAKTTRPKREPLTDQQLADKMRDRVKGSQEKIDRVEAEALVLEQHGRKALKLYQRRQRLIDQVRKVTARLGELGMGFKSGANAWEELEDE